MITGPIIFTWIAGGAVGATAGFWATKMWKKLTHTQEQVKAMQRLMTEQQPGEDTRM